MSVQPRLFARAVRRAALSCPGFASQPAGSPGPRPEAAAGGNRLRALAAAALACFALLPMLAGAAKLPWEEYDKLIKTRATIGAMGPELFGDEVNHYNSALSFSQTDISLPGNNRLPVALTRTYSVSSREPGYPYDFPFLDWDLDLPRLSGVFATDWQDDRCSGHPSPPTVTVGSGSGNDGSLEGDGFAVSYAPQEYWHGNQAHMPAGGEMLLNDQGAPQPTSGGPYRWMTAGFTYFSCLPGIQNGSGEGFLAIGPDGTKYRFDWMAQYYEPELQSAVSGPPWGAARLGRKRNVLYATRVEDRFGNWVSYSYSNAATAPVRLTAIQSSDGRQITIGYTNGQLTSASDGTRTWTYQYANGSLSAVVLPDSSRWTIDFARLSNVAIEYDGDAIRNCDMTALAIGLHDGSGALPDRVAGRITHPSGAMGEFEVVIVYHGRSNVPKACINWETPNNNPQNDVATWPMRHDLVGLKRKRVTGPGLAAMEWTYEATASWSWAAGTGPTCDSLDCAEPKCVSDDCAGTAVTIVNGPNGEWTRFTHGNSYRYNEGKLLRVERGGPEGTVRVETTRYELAQSGQPFKTPIGTSPQSRGDGFTSEHLRPQRSRTIGQDGVNFSRTVNSFDPYARPLSVTRASTVSGNPSRTDVTTYYDHTGLWVLGQVAKETAGGIVAAETGFDSLARPTWHKAFGKLQHTLGYHADGTLASYKDGRNYVTALSNWYRGVPRSIAWPDGTGVSATVNADGTLSSTTDENGFKNCYAYDAMGRLSQITYPSESQAGVCDTSAWNPTTQAFAQVGASEYGIPAGHWRQTVQTGNGVKINYFDALWRPLLAREYDAGNVSASERFTRFAYDHAGRTTFAAYPSTASSPTTGIRTDYDVLGRPTSVVQDSELGQLTTTTRYETGFQTWITNPRLAETRTTHYLAYDEPTTGWPLAIAHPEGVHTTIERDVFGKPEAIARTDGAGIGEIRTYAYNDHQELCRQVEPETGATLMGYDAAGNLTWSASGLPGSTACDATGGTAEILTRKAARTYDARNRLDSLTFPDGRGDQAWSYTPDGLPAQVITSNAFNAPLVINAYNYNRRRMLVGEGVEIAGVHTWSLGYGYNANGHLAVHTYPLGHVVDYAPNALGQPSRAGSHATAASYFPNGALSQFTYGNGIVHTLSQNARGLPVRSRDAYGTSAVLDDSYDYDPNGNVAGISDGATGTNQRGNRDMTYDGLDRLTAVASPMFGGPASYGYDALDNLIRVTIGGSAPRDHHYCYDGSNRLTNIKTGGCTGSTVVGLGYDLQGNVLKKNAVDFDFDYGNRLREADGEAYRYDGHGRRVQSLHAGLGDIYSFYGQDGVLRFQRDERANKARSHVYLGGSLVARLEQAAAPPASAPALTAPASSSTGSYTVSWTSVDAATSYQLQQRKDGGTWGTIHDASGTSKVVSGLATGAYDYRVRACNASGCGAYSTTQTVVVTLPPSGVPTLTAPATSSTGSYTVSWTSVATATRYELQEQVNSGTWATIQNTSAISRSITGKGNGSYGYRVRACNDGGCAPFSSTQTTQVTLPPTGVPTLTAPATSNTGSHTVSWTSVAAATRYELQQRKDGGAWSTIQNAAGTSRAISGLASGTYDYQVRACNDGGCAAFSAIKSTVVTLPPTGVPALTAPATSNTGSYTVSWTSVTAATRYELQEQVNGGAWGTIQNTSAVSRSITGKGNGTYGYQVRACNDGGCAAFSAIASTVVTHPPTSAPTLTAPATSNTGSYTVSWTGVATATRYELQEQVNGGAWGTIQDTSAVSRSITGKGNGTYGYRVRACNVGGCAAFSATASTVVTHPPASAPTLTTPGTSNTGSYTLSWTSVATATRYELQEQVNGGTWGLIQNTSAISRSITGKGNGTYGYRVRACNAGGCAAFSAIKSTVVTHPPANAPALSAPGGLNRTGSYTVSWTSVATATRYELQEMAVTYGGSWTTIHNAAELSKYLSGQSDGQYDYRVRACNVGGCGPYSATGTVYVARSTGDCDPTGFCSGPMAIDPAREDI